MTNPVEIRIGYESNGNCYTMLIVDGVGHCYDFSNGNACTERTVHPRTSKPNNFYATLSGGVRVSRAYARAGLAISAPAHTANPLVPAGKSPLATRKPVLCRKKALHLNVILFTPFFSILANMS